MTRQILVCLLFLYEHIMCTVFALMFLSSYSAHQHKWHILPMTNPSACLLSVSQCVRPAIGPANLCPVAIVTHVSHWWCKEGHTAKFVAILLKRSIIIYWYRTMHLMLKGFFIFSAFNCQWRYSEMPTCWRTKYWYVCLTWWANFVCYIRFDVSVLLLSSLS